MLPIQSGLERSTVAFFFVRFVVRVPGNWEYNASVLSSVFNIYANPWKGAITFDKANLSF